jgi:hypothetical protein
MKTEIIPKQEIKMGKPEDEECDDEVLDDECGWRNYFD